MTRVNTLSENIEIPKNNAAAKFEESPQITMETKSSQKSRQIDRRHIERRTDSQQENIVPCH